MQSRTSRTAYVALLAGSTLGTLASTLMSAPVNVIAAALGASPRGIVLAVSAFTLAMVLTSPLAGWACERLGARRALLLALTLMALGQAGAAASDTLGMLVLMRTVQGIACSVIPPAVQQTLTWAWPERRGTAMAAWASAIGVGQALGPPVGGFVADLLGWRSVFALHALLSVVLLLTLVRVAPSPAAGRPDLRLGGMTTLVLGVGSLVCAVAWVGQDGTVGVGAALVVGGAVALVLHLLLARHESTRLLDPALLTERRFLRSTAAAGTVMACLGVAIVTTPLHLGRDYGLGPGPIGAITLSLALAMALFAPVSARLSERFTARRVLQLAMLALGLSLLLLGLVSGADYGPLVVIATVAALVCVGAAIGAVQANAAFALMRSPAAAHGAALGVHNMMRFCGLAIGYSWVAITIEQHSLFVVYAGPVVLVAGSLALLLGPPAAPVAPTLTEPAR